MKLYHGTSERVARMVLRQGLEPRILREKMDPRILNGNWEHTVPSRNDCIYLTTCYAGYFAINTTDLAKERCAILEIDTEIPAFNTGRLLPDEDCLEQGTRQFPDAIMKDAPMEERTAYFRDHLEDFRQYWKLSLDHLGTCAYQGVIPAKAISRVAFFRFGDNPMFTELENPSITLMNHRHCSDKYKVLNRWLFDGPPDTEKARQDMAGTLYLGVPYGEDAEWPGEMSQMIRGALEEYTKRLGEWNVEVLNLVDTV